MNRTLPDMSINPRLNPLYYAIKELLLNRRDYATAKLKKQSASTRYYKVITTDSDKTFKIAVKKSEGGRELCMVDLPETKGKTIEIEGKSHRIVESHLSFYEESYNQYWLSPMHMTLTFEPEDEDIAQRTIHLYFDSCGQHIKTCQQEKTTEQDVPVSGSVIDDERTQQALLDVYQEHTHSFTDYLFLEIILTEVDRLEKRIGDLTKQLEALSEKDLNSEEHLRDYVSMRETLIHLTMQRCEIEYRPNFLKSTENFFSLARHCYEACVKKLKEIEGRQSLPPSIDEPEPVQVGSEEKVDTDEVETTSKESTSEEYAKFYVDNILAEVEEIKNDRSLTPLMKANSLFEVNKKLLALLDPENTKRLNATPFATLMKLQQAILDNTSLIINQLFHALIKRENREVERILSQLTHIPFECIYAFVIIILNNIAYSKQKQKELIEANVLKLPSDLSADEFFEKEIGPKLPETAIIATLGNCFLKVSNGGRTIADYFYPQHVEKTAKKFVPHLLLRVLDHGDEELTERLFKYIGNIVPQEIKGRILHSIFHSAVIQACTTLRVESLAALHRIYKLQSRNYTLALGQLCSHSFSSAEERAEAKSIAGLLVEWGADVTQNIVSHTGDVVDHPEKPQRVYLTALQTACLSGNLAMVEFLVSLEGRINGRKLITQEVKIHRGLSSSFLDESKSEERARGQSSSAQSQQGREKRYTAVFFAHFCQDERQRQSIIECLESKLSERKGAKISSGVLLTAQERLEQSVWSGFHLQTSGETQAFNKSRLWSPSGSPQHSTTQQRAQEQAGHRPLSTGTRLAG